MTRQLTEAIKQIEGVTRNAQLTPQQFRYVTKQVRVNVGLQVPKLNQTLPNYLTAAEVHFLLDKAKERPEDALLMEFLIFTGLRVAEAANLLVSDVHFTEHVLKVSQGKGSKDRYVPITTNLQSKLLLYLNGRKTGYLFCKSNQTRYTTRALQYRVTYWLIACNFNKELSTHSLRHTFGCLALAKLKDIKQVSVLMGHSSVKTTEIYAKIMLPGLVDDFLRLMDIRG
jgi:integrase/recombinase XerD